jgi:hypothetical protein
MFGFVERSKRAVHRFCQANLSAFMDGQLPARDQERVREHLERCQACQWDLQALRRTVDLLHGLPRMKAPRSFQIPRSVPAPSIPFWMRSWAHGALQVATGVAAAVLVVALAGSALARPARVALSEPEVAVVATSEEMTAMAEAADPSISVEGLHETPSVRGTKNLGAAPAPSEEEAERRAAAPAGLGVHEAPEDPMPEVDVLAAGEEEMPEPEVEPPTVAAEAELAEAQQLQLETDVEEPEDERVPREPLRVVGLSVARQRLASYPWGWWAVGSGGLLAALLAVTLWLGAKRARWP